MLKLYDYLEAIMEEQNDRRWFYETRLHFFAGDLMDTLDINDQEEISQALQRVFQACSTLRIPIYKNFKKVYRSNGNELFPDWKISPLASYLMIINCDPRHENVAKAQLFFAMNQARK